MPEAASNDRLCFEGGILADLSNRAAKTNVGGGTNFLIAEYNFGTVAICAGEHRGNAKRFLTLGHSVGAICVVLVCLVPTLHISCCCPVRKHLRRCCSLVSALRSIDPQIVDRRLRVVSDCLLIWKKECLGI